ncbi:LPD25 domain-containing protein [Lysinibacillus sphaericus]|uniref:LPD25 domain-containing protein n=1 Tax=Lysinibacillus TaxID=400634 RepID=UPI00068B59B8|nr:LPD25 domain-containing protein [Lysinibacillus sphaericus]MEE3806736.1 LPD25 domain-containing protein [Lysinibacillus fusiformis]QTB24410.1 ImmA/IrrE family metallo-endopeptidase [Lysinibacillus sphaericus]
MVTARKKYTAKTAEEKQKEIEELSEKMTNQLSAYFVSEEALKEHLAFMSIFYNYSLRNMTLIQSQFMGAQAVGSFKFWQDKGVSVKRGEKGIQLFVPTPVTYFNRDGEWIQMQYANSKEKMQIKNGILETQKKLFFKIGHVFEYTQTDAREKGMPVSEIFDQYYQDGVIDNEDEMLVALHKVSENVGFEILPIPPRELGVAKGVAYPNEKIIALNPRNTAYENVTTLLHELAHARLHTPDVRDSFTKAEREFQAEMVSYVMASRYGIDTENFSLSYLAGWTQQGKELKDKEMLLNGVRTAASEFIETIDQHFSEINRSKENELMQSKQLLLIEYGALSNASLRTIETEDLKEIIHDIITNKVEQLQHSAFKQELDQLRNVSDNLLTFEQVNADFIQVFNNAFKDNFALINQQEVTNPKILIQWSESELMSNELMGFAEGNDRMAKLEKEVFFDKEKAYSYLKTRYHVLIPNGDTVDLINPDRLDIGDGEYKSPYEQLIAENKLTEMQHHEILRELALYTHEKQQAINTKLKRKNLEYVR